MAHVELKSARTSESDPNRAATALCEALGSAKPKLVTLFASSDRDHLALNRAMRERLPSDTRIIGATTSGEIDNAGMHNGTVVASALSGDLEVGVGLGRGLSDDAVAAGAQALAKAASSLDVRPQDLDPKKYVGIVIDDGARYKKEELLLGVLDKCPSLMLVGGGAAHATPNAPDAISYVHADGEVATDSVLVALVKTNAHFGALRSHWYTPTGERVRITKVDDTCTRALEIDDKPAAERYAEILGVTVDDLEFGKPKGFSLRPTAMKVGREHFIRAPWKPLPDGSILFANLLEADSELELMQLGDPSGMTRKFFEEELPMRVPSPTAALLFHCGGRVWVAQSLGETEKLSASFAAAPPCAGFNVHFEIYSGFQINTTLTVLAFGKNDA
ncbi:MAG TPA: FIST N-terminal domain-containing protein [Labilithrix sp.]|nr:FIST N-terminal domain-containing protein [Labilithrix sp.]